MTEDELTIIYNRIIQRVVRVDEAEVIEGQLQLDCIVQENGELIQRTLLIEVPGQERIREALNVRPIQS